MLPHVKHIERVGIMVYRGLIQEDYLHVRE
jgi:hypothetical protein